MKITSIEIIKTENNARQLADVKIIIDGCLLIRNVKLIDNGKRIFVAFSETKRENSDEKSVDVIPLKRQVRKYIEREVIREYNNIERQAAV